MKWFKEKIASWIIDEMPLKKGTVLDIFAGGCSVSYALKNAGYKVISNDILYADYVIAKALIENESGYISSDVFETIVDEKNIKKEKRNKFFSGQIILS